MKREETHMDKAVLTDVLTNLTEEVRLSKTLSKSNKKLLVKKTRRLKTLFVILSKNIKAYR